jgi:(1->4)-alpha-D-glucan 1-alpha-D-glucosylmutase
MLETGVPDIYQGNEVWNFSLVDPDNRRPLDFEVIVNTFHQLEKRMQSLQPLQLIQQLIQDMHSSSGDIKMFVTHKLLQLRKAHSDLFTSGEYIPLDVVGDHKDHLVAFARSWSSGQGDARSWVIVLTGRFFASLSPQLVGDAWKGTQLTLSSLHLPQHSFQDVFSGQVFQLSSDLPVPICAILAHLPFSVLLSMGH